LIRPKSWRVRGTRQLAKLHIATFELSSGGSIPPFPITLGGRLQHDRGHYYLY